MEYVSKVEVKHLVDGVAIDYILLEFVQQGEDIEEVVLHGLGKVDGVVSVVALKEPDKSLILVFESFPQLFEVLSIPLQQRIPQVLVKEGFIVHKLQAHL